MWYIPHSPVTFPLRFYWCVKQRQTLSRFVYLFVNCATIAFVCFLAVAIALCKYSQAEWNATKAPANKTVSCSPHDNSSNCAGTESLYLLRPPQHSLSLSLSLSLKLRQLSVWIRTVIPMPKLWPCAFIHFKFFLWYFYHTSLCTLWWDQGFISAWDCVHRWRCTFRAFTRLWPFHPSGWWCEM